MKQDSYWFKNLTKARRGYSNRRKKLIEQMKSEEMMLDHYIISGAASYMNPKSVAEWSEKRDLTTKGIDALRIELLEITLSKPNTSIKEAS